MFPARYFAPRFYAPRYFAEVGADISAFAPFRAVVMDRPTFLVVGTDRWAYRAVISDRPEGA